LPSHLPFNPEVYSGSMPNNVTFGRPSTVEAQASYFRPIPQRNAHHFNGFHEGPATGVFMHGYSPLNPAHFTVAAPFNTHLYPNLNFNHADRGRYAPMLTPIIGEKCSETTDTKLNTKSTLSETGSAASDDTGFSSNHSLQETSMKTIQDSRNNNQVGETTIKAEDDDGSDRHISVSRSPSPAHSGSTSPTSGDTSMPECTSSPESAKSCSFDVASTPGSSKPWFYVKLLRNQKLSCKCSNVKKARSLASTSDIPQYMQTCKAVNDVNMCWTFCF